MRLCNSLLLKEICEIGSSEPSITEVYLPSNLIFLFQLCITSKTLHVLASLTLPGQTHPQRLRCWAGCSQQSTAYVFQPDRHCSSWCYNPGWTGKYYTLQCLCRSERSRRIPLNLQLVHWRPTVSRFRLGLPHIVSSLLLLEPRGRWS